MRQAGARPGSEQRCVGGMARRDALGESVMQKRLYRSRTDRMLLGVCGGLGKYFDVDPTLVRVIAVVLLLLGLTGILVYLVLAVVIPVEPGEAASV